MQCFTYNIYKNNQHLNATANCFSLYQKNQPQELDLNVIGDWSKTIKQIISHKFCYLNNGYWVKKSAFTESFNSDTLSYLTKKKQCNCTGTAMRSNNRFN